MTRFMLDTNIVSHLLREHPAVVARVRTVPMASLCISAITEAELQFGLAKRPGNKALHQAVHELLIRVESIAWSSTAAQTYGKARLGMMQSGKTLAPLDLLIASHALSMNALLVTNDQAISQLAGLQVQDWTLSPAAAD
jgi:tRNA(fMet)-specific endonuclease VapC